MIKFITDAHKLADSSHDLVLCAPSAFYRKKWHHPLLGKDSVEIFDKLVSKNKCADKSFSFSHYDTKHLKKITVIALSDEVSFCNSPARKNEIYAEISKYTTDEKLDVIIGVEDEDFAPAAVAALARCLEKYNKKAKAKSKHFGLAVTGLKAEIIKPTVKMKSIAESIAWVCHLVDSPAEEVNPQSYAKMIKDRFSKNPSVKYKDLVGDKLIGLKMGGVHAVGRSAMEEPRVVILEYTPKTKAKKTVLLVGKGVTYDTGGLSLKISGAMCEMKSDMGGSAAVLGAFEMLVASGSKHKIIAIVGLVENAIGPDAYRNDDILTMHSGKTVEINNTDAEGRLVLADCLSYGCRTYKPDLAIEAATLTGAQLVATGIRHAAVVTNERSVLNLAEKASCISGDLVSPLPFAPEFFQEEFSSKVADMRNSVKNRMNAQSSCAAQFIYSHIDDLKVSWAHIDLAGPSFVSSRATGYGVGLISEMVHLYE